MRSLDRYRSAFARLPEIQRGIAWMVASVLLASLMDVAAKFLVRDVSIVQITWARFTIPLVILVLYYRRSFAAHVRSRHPALQVARSFLILAANLSFYQALISLPLADVASITAVGPILVTVLAIPLLGEKVGLRRWAAVLAGFAGTLVIVRPGFAEFSFGAVFAFGAALTFSLFQIVTRRLRTADSAITALIYSHLVGAMATTAALPAVWVWPDPMGWLQMALIGTLATVGHFGVIRAFMLAPAAAVAPFAYTNLVWAATFGFLFFGDLPDAFTVGGAAIIVAAGLYILHRERVRRAAERSLTAPPRD